MYLEGGQKIFQQILERNDPKLNQDAKTKIFNQVFN